MSLFMGRKNKYKEIILLKEQYHLYLIQYFHTIYLEQKKSIYLKVIILV